MSGEPVDLDVTVKKIARNVFQPYGPVMSPLGDMALLSSEHVDVAICTRRNQTFHADAFRAAARRAAVLGCEGKWAIHPSQIVLANEVMSPSEADVNRAKRILVAMDEAAKAGKGAVSLDGRLIDAASIRMAGLGRSAATDASETITAMDASQGTSQS